MTLRCGDGATASPARTARLAAVLYIVSGVPAGYSVSTFTKLVVRSDAAATAANVLRSEGAFRLAFAGDLVGILLVLGSLLLLYGLFKPVNASLARFVMSAVIIGSTLQALNALGDLAALLLLKGGAGLSALSTGQAQALALVFLRLHMLSYDIALVFYGAGYVVMGPLLLQATFLPRILGPLIVLDGLGYMTLSFTLFLAPPVAAHLHPFVPYGTAILGEGSLMLWLLVKGVNAERWHEQAAAA